MMSRTSTAKADRRRLAAVIVLTAIVRMAETAVDAVDVRVAAAAGIVGAVGAADGLAAAGGIVADAGDRVEAAEGTKKFLPRIVADSHSMKGHDVSRGLFSDRWVKPRSDCAGHFELWVRAKSGASQGDPANRRFSPMCTYLHRTEQRSVWFFPVGSCRKLEVSGGPA